MTANKVILLASATLALTFGRTVEETEDSFEQTFSIEERQYFDEQNMTLIDERDASSGQKFFRMAATFPIFNNLPRTQYQAWKQGWRRMSRCSQGHRDPM